MLCAKPGPSYCHQAADHPNQAETPFVFLLLTLPPYSSQANGPPPSNALVFMVSRMLVLTDNIYCYLTSAQQSRYLTFVVERVGRAMLAASVEDLKGAAKDFFGKVAQNMRATVARVMAHVPAFPKKLEKIVVQMSLKLLGCPFLEKRISGLQDIRQMAERAVCGQHPDWNRYADIPGELTAAELFEELPSGGFV